ncbi:MAG: tRNA (adenosine(37)-N6)-threonylcarbamoyltransferase complex ATPase subunit type 1 TsaE [Gemmatimonadetes bacterium]|nr:tRNA (adenosine(37)-N6)-threonylcarbamoyltransferase complex ATPase subunit type 1 TsaE [Gemmatimonadota bacterium]
MAEGRVVPAGADAEVRTGCPRETEAVGFGLGLGAFPGAVLLLEGPLGSGKTALARGAGVALGVRDPLTSPTFTLLSESAGRLPVFHLDLYRVAGPEELRAFDLVEVLESGGVTIVEWPRWLLAEPPGGALRVDLAVLTPAERRLQVRILDPRWEGWLARARRNAAA